MIGDKKGYKKTKIGYIPEDWKVLKVEDCMTPIKKPIDPKPNEKYREIGVRSHGKGIFYKDAIKGADLGNKRVFKVEPHCFIVNIVFAWEQAVAKTTLNESGFIASHRFPMYQPKRGILNLDFITNYFNTPRGKYLLGVASPGGAGRNKTLGRKNFAELLIPVPGYDEQVRISEVLTTWDKAIRKNRSLISKLETQKKIIAENLINKDFDSWGNREDWRTIKLKEVLGYEQPNDYLVSDTNYSDQFKTPVLTAGKTFILGYTDEQEGVYTPKNKIILFDDFTTSSKLVSFPFKLKSSAAKILYPKSDLVDLEFIYEAMQVKNYKPIAHRRHWISQYSEFEFNIPNLNRQKEILKILTGLNTELRIVKEQLNLIKKQKKGLMQRLFKGENRFKSAQNG
ncbi:restriction endonuclease subunit S [Parvicella tangerina]|uniref:Type I restriction modification DNA specificity domain-containing protein n=1 Tax=Parvicella tangerina TaxID=2829795 RepID=A0A916N8T2_9FLAO|nr:restriction endonuclease subunit S [Parvicella tangerina]CAG5077568.1 hypothetical protein CRYO30217_00428 [Parvicella tangerina]